MSFPVTRIMIFGFRTAQSPSSFCLSSLTEEAQVKRKSLHLSTECKKMKNESDELICVQLTGGVKETLSYEMFVQSYRSAAFMLVGIITWGSFAVFGFIFPFLLVSFSSSSLLFNDHHWSFFEKA